ncbi:MAG: hypothetical protein K8R87_00895 [Verrucomicrobia bacterium]|nr:hypothetical protein [Verrucomicrobiota bacterium]
MNKSIQFICCAALVFITGCRTQRESYRTLPSSLSTAVWRTHDSQTGSASDLAPPEMDLLPELRRKDDLGIAVSGGGVRAAVAALGQFRALKTLGLLDRARYISSNSGGTWFCAPFVYASPALLPNDASLTPAKQLGRMTQNRYDDVFLGNYAEPEALNLAKIHEAPEGCYIRAVTQVNMRIPALFRGNGSQSYSRVVSAAFLKPFGLDAPDKSFTWSREWFDRHVALHQAGGLTPDNFYFSVTGRPYLIMNEAIAFPRRASTFDRMGFFLRHQRRPASVPDYKAFYPVESTPLYTGVRPFAQAASRNEKPVGGGYVETFAYGSRFDRWESEANRSRAVVTPVAQSHRLPPALFSLSDAVGDSGAAVAAVAGGLAGLVNLEPKRWHWAPSSDQPKTDEQRLPHVDGGTCDNSGVIALLERRTSRIICLSNALFRLPQNGGRGEIAPWDISSEVTALFGAPGSTMLLNIIGQPAANHVLNRTLPDGRDAMEDLAGELSERNMTGRPLVVCREYRTIANSRYDISGGRRVKICWVFLTFTRLHEKGGFSPPARDTIMERWIASLPPDSREFFTVDKKIRETRLGNFPDYRIVQENKHPQQLSAVQANALAHYAAFCVKEAGPEIRQGLGL